ncbi:hypothetical protein H6P81_013690 [Aristolochia fimbriata]|uniref:Chalcone-flavonone isomerase family protein n=1 Tax=Aristolochia fimbriata TaxID=158543 RepID=A0AAV7EFF0_ARIFI|nr:hypothetical protein H6P81_013690 [Aristolochia fimbriata]
MAGAMTTATIVFLPISSYDSSLSHSRSPLLCSRRGIKSLPCFSEKRRLWAPFVKASAASAQLVVEPGTKVKFEPVISVPGCSDSLKLLGTGYREKVFAIIGVKVYAAGMYMNQSIADNLDAWKGKSASEIQQDSTLFTKIFEAPPEKSLKIVLVRDVEGKTFWDALDEAISPRIKAPIPTDESALSVFRNTFQGRPLKQGTFIFLSWVDPSKMLVSISSDGLPSTVDATIESSNVASALFDVFLGDTPVSPPLKASVASGLAMLLQ